MTKREAFNVDENGDEKLCCTITFNGKEVTFKGQKETIDLISEVYIFGKVFKPQDGAEYMRVLPLAFRGSRFYVA